MLHGYIDMLMTASWGTHHDTCAVWSNLISWALRQTLYGFIWVQYLHAYPNPWTTNSRKHNQALYAKVIIIGQHKSALMPKIHFAFESSCQSFTLGVWSANLIPIKNDLSHNRPSAMRLLLFLLSVGFLKTDSICPPFTSHEAVPSNKG